jgi:rRNA maturation endonuclease Nob1
VADFARKVGEYITLSRVDMKVIALTHMFHSEMNGEVDIKLTPQVVVKEEQEVTQKSLNDAINASASESDSAGDGDQVIDSVGDEYQVSEDESDWITPENIEDMKATHNLEVAPLLPANVGCITADFAMQACLFFTKYPLLLTYCRMLCCKWA